MKAYMLIGSLYTSGQVITHCTLTGGEPLHSKTEEYGYRSWTLLKHHRKNREGKKYLRELKLDLVHPKTFDFKVI